MFSHSKQSSSTCGMCGTTSMVIGVIGVIGTLASLINVLMSHILPSGLTFGTSQGSVALIALALNLFLVMKVLSTCPCTLPTKKK